MAQIKDEPVVVKQDANRHRERIIDMQQWCAQYPELTTLQRTLARARHEFEQLTKESKLQ